MGLFLNPWKAKKAFTPGISANLFARSSQSPPEASNRPEVVHRRRSSHVRHHDEEFYTDEQAASPAGYASGEAARPAGAGIPGGSARALQQRDRPPDKSRFRPAGSR